MQYTSLNIHQRINAKGNSITLWGRNESRMIYRKRNDSIWDVSMYGPDRLRSKPVYKDDEPSEPDYNAVSLKELSEMAYKQKYGV